MPERYQVKANYLGHPGWIIIDRKTDKQIACFFDKNQEDGEHNKENAIKCCRALNGIVY